MSAAMGVGMFIFDAVPATTKPDPAKTKATARAAKTKPADGGGGVASRWMLHQAANDGFRGVLLVCFDGPDASDGPRGLVVLANGKSPPRYLILCPPPVSNLLPPPGI
jgi:hypothetical protein